MRFYLATTNHNKLREFREILGDVEPIDIDVEENGSSFEENALIKARAACRLTGEPAVADDSGLCVDALGGEPGIYSARYSEVGDRKAKILRELQGEVKRSAKFVSAIAAVFPDGEEFTARGEVRGEITDKPYGDNGFGYDPIFYMPEFGKTMAELTPELKNAASHRGKAIQAMLKQLKARGVPQ
ncbi:MAG: RdgB/HAM1 family non-canonical purine NTP pyrophosphatase [Oscillospiraceae bacterium]|jgi:XTP/dITP diphosphohydrolase|nr:RdgB/HAM1 family non-canonical purine NTP pyrophosphatase [Oscillospiraceae bacterium]